MATPCYKRGNQRGLRPGLTGSYIGEARVVCGCIAGPAVGWWVGRCRGSFACLCMSIVLTTLIVDFDAFQSLKWLIAVIDITLRLLMSSRFNGGENSHIYCSHTGQLNS